MEINLIPTGDQPLGAVAQEDMVEGRFVCLTANVHSIDFGSMTDLPGVELPDSSGEAARAIYVVAWSAPDREVSPGNLWFVPTPSYGWALRQGWDRDANLPMTSTTVRMTWPGNQTSVTIPSGTKVLLLGPGAVVTLPSGQYVYNSNLETPGARVEVEDTAGDDQGKPTYLSGGTAVAEVIRYNSSDASLQIRLL